MGCQLLRVRRDAPASNDRRCLYHLRKDRCPSGCALYVAQAETARDLDDQVGRLPVRLPPPADDQVGAPYLRRVVIPDLRAMIEAARDDGVDLWVSSAYRSYATQVSTYGYFVSTRGIEWADTRSARPGHSQHQLGTAVDFNTPGQFAVSPAGQWLWAHAQDFGFVFPYTPASSAQTGYVFEPWHLRWVGRDLAQLLRQLGYQDSADVTADDYVAMARAALIQAIGG